MFYLLQSEDNVNILIDRLSNEQVILRSQVDEVILPVFKGSNAKLSFIFSGINVSHEAQASQLDWDDTSKVITNILGDTPNIDNYKPSCMMFSSVSITQSDDYNRITVSFSSYYRLWKKVKSGDGTYEFQVIETDPHYFDTTVNADTYQGVLVLINLYTREEAEALLHKSLYPDYQAYNILMESGERTLAESGETIIGQTIYPSTE